MNGVSGVVGSYKKRYTENTSVRKDGKGILRMSDGIYGISVSHSR